MPVYCPVERDQVGTREPLEIGPSQVRRGGLDVFQDGKKPFTAFHFLELQAAEEAGESLRHGAFSDGSAAVSVLMTSLNIIR